MSPRRVLLIVALTTVFAAAPAVAEAQSAAARMAVQRQAAAYYQASVRYQRVRNQQHHWIGYARDAINRYGVSDKVRKHRTAARRRSAIQRRRVARLRAQLKKAGTETPSRGQQKRVNPFLRSAPPGSDQPLEPIRQTPRRGLGAFLAVVD